MCKFSFFFLVSLRGEDFVRGGLCNVPRIHLLRVCDPWQSSCSQELRGPLIFDVLMTCTARSNTREGARESRGVSVCLRVAESRPAKLSTH